jgi:hypothetical protein
MSFSVKDIKIVENESFILALFDLLFLILPGVAVIYVFNNPLIHSADWIKLILISGSLTIPLALINTFFLIPFTVSKQGNGNGLFLAFSLSLMVSGLILYSMIGVHYFFDRPLREGIYFVLVIEAILLIAAYLKIRKLRRS